LYEELSIAQQKNEFFGTDFNVQKMALWAAGIIWKKAV